MEIGTGREESSTVETKVVSNGRKSGIAFLEK